MLLLQEDYNIKIAEHLSAMCLVMEKEGTLGQDRMVMEREAGSGCVCGVSMC